MLLCIMEMERVFEFPHTHMDRRPRKRARLGWDIPEVPKAQVGLFCGQDVGTISSFAPSRGPSENTTSSLFVKPVARNGSPPWRDDDKDGHYIYIAKWVLECWDRERKEMVAVKIVRGIKKYREAAMIEIEVLQQLVMHDLRMIHTDLKPENILLVSPEYVKVPDYKSSSRSPSSYFKRVPKSSAIKVIDFGSTTYEREDQNYIVSTRLLKLSLVYNTYCKCCGKNACLTVFCMLTHDNHEKGYMQAKVDFGNDVLGLGWSYPCDIWSVGCILVELCTGGALFQTHENLEHLAMMERVLGPLPQPMLKRVDRHAEKYVRRGRLDWPEGATSRESIKAVMKLPRLQNLVMQHVDHSAGDLIHLLQGLLRYDPSERLTAKEALRHSFFMRDQFRR
ncbi:Serine/threonine-protein kinase AFC2 [Glycine soja]